eukprot:TRINITY_DN93503_c0_g1_i1.p1 TRINITY_DN93503_c0_g1~~TRINITY_DN93503_c0_g1_i1.p1  ORF type:complete len:162 (+),score=60.57 TRINITY_DN93503_c0_g1_i1:141-626(+)
MVRLARFLSLAAIVVASARAADDAETTLKKSVNATVELRRTVQSVMSKSVEEVKTLKSLLTTNAKATGAMNDLLLQMENLSQRMGKFDSSMEQCRQEISKIEAASSQVITAEEADDPTVSLLQLQQHASELHAQAQAAVTALGRNSQRVVPLTGHLRATQL